MVLNVIDGNESCGMRMVNGIRWMIINMVDVNKYDGWYMADVKQYSGWYILDVNKYSGW